MRFSATASSNGIAERGGGETRERRSGIPIEDAETDGLPLEGTGKF